MHKIFARAGAAIALCLSWVDTSYAVDSYRFLHVTVDTPWNIFIFLLLGVFAPFILMAALVWRNTERKPNQEKKDDAIVAEADK